MYLAWISLLMLLTIQHVSSFKIKDLKFLNVYYDSNNKPVPMLTNISDVLPTLRTPSVRFGPLPCSCQDYTCGCCVNMNIQLFNFQRQGCTNFTYDPYEFSVGMNMLWNDESVYNTSISGKNPPPFCLQAPIPYLPAMDQCIRIFNIFTPGRNIHMCMNLETRIERAPVLILQFDCMRMGADGVALLKPEDEGGLMTSQEGEETSTSTESPQEGASDFDNIDSDKKKTNVTVGADNNQTNSSVISGSSTEITTSKPTTKTVPQVIISIDENLKKKTKTLSVTGGNFYIIST